MPETEWLNLTTYSSDNANGGAVAWSSASSASTQDDTGATVAYTDATATPTSEYLKGLQVVGLNTTGWDSISQVDVRVRAKDVATGSTSCNTTRLSLVIGGTVQTESDTTPAGPYTSSFVNYDYSLTSDLPTAAQAAASDFGVVFEFTDSGSGPRNGTVHCDVIQVRFTYSRTTQTPDPIAGTLTYRIHALVENGEELQEWESGKHTVEQVNAGGVIARFTDAASFTLDTGASIITPGWVLFRNVSTEADHRITYGPMVSGAVVPFGRIEPGECAIFQLDPDVTIGVESPFFESVLLYWMLNK